MSSEPQRSREDLARQVGQHLESLRGAGVEWLPRSKQPLLVAELPGARPEAAPESSQAPAVQQGLPFGTELEVAGAGELSLEQRRHELQLLAEQVAGCTRCAGLAATRTQTVFGVGRIEPELCFIGEAPGATEDARGEPFVGEAGQLLNRIIAACGLKREDVYICNIIKCRPPGNRLPLPDEAAHCREYLERQLELVRPKFLCALGACAAQNLLNTTTPIGRMRGKFYDYRGIPVLCTYHPAFLLRSPERKKDVWEDMKKLLARMGRPVAQK
jgi:uracil-DNA glycosylase family 4